MRNKPEPKCPVRPGQPCTLCQVSVTGPEDCGLVYLVMTDPQLRAALQAAPAPDRIRSNAPNTSARTHSP